MVVPAFFKWVTEKYPSIISDCIETKVVKSESNEAEFDNLYLDMNSIINSCARSESRSPKDEGQMMISIFAYIDTIFSIVRPRRLLYMAIDGVGPRAKMNQQRSRRFMASKEAAEKAQEMTRKRSEIQSRGCLVPPETNTNEHFDSNCITPGTPFMQRLSICLNYYIHIRMQTEADWRNIAAILSDASVPGEGKYKIIDYIRRQRAHPCHDPNTRHALCGADADLILLGLTTHEPHFTIIREKCRPNNPRPCDICNQLGHEMKDCTGLDQEENEDYIKNTSSIITEKQSFIFVHLYVLREYLAIDLAMPNLPFPYDLDRAIDDWVFLCFFVDNDFLPRLPSLEFCEKAIDLLTCLYKETVIRSKGWLTGRGFVDLERVQIMLHELGAVEQEMSRKRQQDELNFGQRKRSKKRRRLSGVISEDQPAYFLEGAFAPRSIGAGYDNPISNVLDEIRQSRVQALRFRTESLHGSDNTDQVLSGCKRKTTNQDQEADFIIHEQVRFWEDGFKDRYYENKFGVSGKDPKFRNKVACEYFRGLCWMLQYYYQGCPSWDWYYPYHYAPFVSDFMDILSVQTTFETTTKPCLPLEHLMSVLPAASRTHVPECWAKLMTDSESEIIDLYPQDFFDIDMNGKKCVWQGVALLPFVDQVRLKRAIDPLMESLTPDERSRNVHGVDVIFVVCSSSFSASRASFSGLKLKEEISRRPTVRNQGSATCSKT